MFLETKKTYFTALALGAVVGGFLFTQFSTISEDSKSILSSTTPEPSTIPTPTPEKNIHDTSSKKIKKNKSENSPDEIKSTVSFPSVATTDQFKNAISAAQISPGQDLDVPQADATFQKLADNLKSFNAKGAQEAATCNCLNPALAGTESGDLLGALSDVEYEDINKCTKQSRYVVEKDKANANIPEIFKKLRPVSDDPDIPPISCFTHIMKNSILPAGQEDKKNKLLVTCAGPNATPVSPAYKPCISEEYVTIIYNEFNDTMKCFGMSSKELLPKFQYESGLFTNAMNEEGDASLGELTKPAIADVNSDFDSYIDAFKDIDQNKSDKLDAKHAFLNNSYCKKIAPFMKGLKKLSTEPKFHSCNLMIWPSSPLLNSIYLAIFQKRIYDAAERAFEGAHQNFQDAGYQPTSDDKKQILRALSYHMYNSGPGTTAKFFSRYMNDKARLVKNNMSNPLTINDFNFLRDTAYIIKIRDEVGNLDTARSLTSTFQTLWKMEEADPKTFTDETKKELLKLCPQPAKFKQTYATPVKGKNGKVGTNQVKSDFYIKGKTCTAAIEDAVLSRSGFKNYLTLYQNSVGAFYVTAIAKKALDINTPDISGKSDKQEFREGKCVPVNYLGSK